MTLHQHLRLLLSLLMATAACAPSDPTLAPAYQELASGLAEEQQARLEAEEGARQAKEDLLALREEMADLGSEVAHLELLVHSARGAALEARTRARQLQLPPGDPRREAPIRTCIRRSGGLGPDWKEEAVSVGPLAFYPARQLASLPAEHFAPGPEGRPGGEELLILLEGGHVASVVVPESHVGRISMLYDESEEVVVDSVDDGHRAMTFVACSDRRSRFRGNVFVDGAGCFPLEVYSNDQDHPERVVLSFGAGDCRFSLYSNLVELGPGQTGASFLFEAPDPPTHAFDVQLEMPEDAELEISFVTSNRMTLLIFDPTRREGNCEAFEARLRCELHFPALEAPSAGTWTALVAKRSEAPAAISVSVSFIPVALNGG